MSSEADRILLTRLFVRIGKKRDNLVKLITEDFVRLFFIIFQFRLVHRRGSQQSDHIRQEYKREECERHCVYRILEKKEQQSIW